MIRNKFFCVILLATLSFIVSCNGKSTNGNDGEIVFYEVQPENNGKLEKKILTLEKYYWSEKINPNEQLIEDLHYSIFGEIPEGLELKIEKKSKLEAKIYFEGKAVNHHVNDSVVNCIQLEFKTKAFLGGSEKAKNFETDIYCLKIQFGKPLKLSGKITNYYPGIEIKEVSNGEKIEITSKLFEFTKFYEKEQEFSIQFVSHPDNLCCYFQKSTGKFNESDINDLSISCNFPQWGDLVDNFGMNPGNGWIFLGSSVFNHPDTMGFGSKKNHNGDIILNYRGDLGSNTDLFFGKMDYFSYYIGSEGKWYNPPFNQKINKFSLLKPFITGPYSIDDFSFQDPHIFLSDTNPLFSIYWSQKDELESNFPKGFLTKFTGKRIVSSKDNELPELQSEPSNVLFKKFDGKNIYYLYRYQNGPISQLKSVVHYPDGSSSEQYIIKDISDSFTQENILELVIIDDRPLYLFLKGQIFKFQENNSWILESSFSMGNMETAPKKTFSQNGSKFILAISFENVSYSILIFIGDQNNINLKLLNFFDQGYFNVDGLFSKVFLNQALVSFQLQKVSDNQLYSIKYVPINFSTDYANQDLEDFDIFEDERLDHYADFLEFQNVSKSYSVDFNSNGDGIFSIFHRPLFDYNNINHFYSGENYAVDSLNLIKIREVKRFNEILDIEIVPSKFPRFNDCDSCGNFHYSEDSHKTAMNVGISESGHKFVLYKSRFTETKSDFYLSIKGDQWIHPQSVNDKIPLPSSFSAGQKILYSSINNCGALELGFIGIGTYPYQISYK